MKILVVLNVITILSQVDCLPVLSDIGSSNVVQEELSKDQNRDNFEKFLEDYLSKYYDKHVEGRVEVEGRKLNKKQEAATGAESSNIYDAMQGDQPLEASPSDPTVDNLPSDGSLREMEYLLMMRNRSKDNWIQTIKTRVLEQLGRDNATLTVDENRFPQIKISDMIPGFLNGSFMDDDRIAEKIRSFYPSCDEPTSDNQDVISDENLMNLFFAFDNNIEERSEDIATATLRLYRIPDGNTSLEGFEGDCDHNTENDGLLRITIYWYKTTRRRRVRRRIICDSKMMAENARWVELSVKQAAKSWTRGQNLGLAVQVEDQEGNILKADRYFKGASCTVGASTPRPIPTIIVDAARSSNELYRINSLLGRNSTEPVHSDLLLLPIIDICTIELPKNDSDTSAFLRSRLNACNLRQIYEQRQRLAQKEKLERLATLPDSFAPSSRHIRHQRQHLASVRNMSDQTWGFDPRSKMIDRKVLITNTELQSYNLQKLNVSTPDR